MVDGAGIEGEEVGVGEVHAFHGRTGDRQGDPLTLPGEDSVEAGGGGSVGQRLGDGRAPLGVRLGQAVGDGKGDGEDGVLGHADVGADQERYGGLQGHGLTGPGAGRDHDRHGQQHLVVIAVVHQRAGRLARGGGPDDVARAPPGGQGPDDARGVAGVAGIAPIGVPALVDLLAQSDVGGGARRDALVAGHQLGLDMAGVDRLGRSGEGRQQDQCGQNLGK